MRRLSGLIKYLPQDNSPKLMCWACSCSYKRALAKTKHSDPARSGILVILVFVICFVLFWRFRLLCCDSILVDNIFLSQALNCFHKREKEKVSRWRKKGERTPKREVSAYDRYVYEENTRILFTQYYFSILCWIHWASEVIQPALKPLLIQNMTAGTCTRKCRRDLMWLNRSFPTLVSRFLPTRLPSPVTL